MGVDMRGNRLREVCEGLEGGDFIALIANCNASKEEGFGRGNLHGKIQA